MSRDVTHQVREGYLFPDFDDVPDDHLGLVLDGAGGTFWADSWCDTEEHHLEDALAQVLEEIRLRHEHLVKRRLVEREQYKARQRQDEEDRARATVRYRQQFLRDTMIEQAERWEHAARLRRYADAVRSQAQRLDHSERERALLWADQIDAEAAQTDPLPAAAMPPDIPEPTYSDLVEFIESPNSHRW